MDSEQGRHSVQSSLQAPAQERHVKLGGGGSPSNHQPNETVPDIAPVHSTPPRIAAAGEKREKRGRERVGRQRNKKFGETEGTDDACTSSGYVEASTKPTLTFSTPHTSTKTTSSHPHRQHANATAIFGPPVNFNSDPPPTHPPKQPLSPGRATVKLQPPSQQWRSTSRGSPALRKIELPDGESLMPAQCLWFVQLQTGCGGSAWHGWHVCAGHGEVAVLGHVPAQHMLELH